MVEKLPLTSKDILAEKIARIREEFPEVFSEGKIDFERLKMSLGEFVDNGRERYGLSWAGKSEAIRNIQTPSVGTLLPVPEESVNFDTSENLIIEGDNLEVLKLLQKSYHGKIKMIYIDPPYNTGNEFIYPDNFREGLDDYLRYSGQVDGDGIRLSTNTETDGRFHSKWLNMMYPRLFLAKNLLREDGAIFVSIDDHEVKNLCSLLDEIFGEENFVAQAIWQKKYAPQNDAKTISPLHEYVLVYARNCEIWRPNLLPRSEEGLARYKNPDNDPRGPWKPGDLTSKTKAAGHSYTITSPTGKVHYPTSGRQWAPSKETFERLLNENRIWFGSDGNNVPSLKQFLSEVQDGTVPVTLWMRDEVGDNQEAAREVSALGIPFDSPKPVRLVKHMLKIGTNPGSGDIVLDFFAGSGTTAHAVLDINAEDKGNRRFLLVQLPEQTQLEEFSSIAEITKERIRLVVDNLVKDDGIDKTNLDAGFRVFKLASSSFKTWNAGAIPQNTEKLSRQLTLFADNVRSGRKERDLLFEIVLKSGLELTDEIDEMKFNRKTIFSIGGGALLICLDSSIDPETVKNMVAQNPRNVVCLDAAFHGNDNLKTNTKLLMESHSIEFHTV